MRNAAVRCLIITGADPAFCSGDDVKQIMAGGEGARPPVTNLAPRLTPAADALLHIDIPTIAAVNGPTIGWGMELSLMADIRVASEKARFGELFIKRGLCCDVPGIGRLAQLVGRETAAELLFTGDIIDANRALQIRLVSRVVPHEQLLPTATEIARKVASNPPLGIGRLKKWTPPRARSGLERTWLVGQQQPGRTVQNRRPSRRSSIIPGEARIALRRQVSAGLLTS
jgi:enoyl-CoA hydratase